MAGKPRRTLRTPERITTEVTEKENMRTQKRARNLG
jgi:hypothetical protein